MQEVAAAKTLAPEETPGLKLLMQAKKSKPRRKDTHACEEMKSLSRVRLFATPWTLAYQASLSMGFSRQEYWSGCHFLLQGIILTQEWNPGLPHCWRRKWQPTPVLLPGESHGQRSLVGCSPWGHTESDTTEATWQQHITFRSLIHFEFISVYGMRKCSNFILLYVAAQFSKNWEI